MQRGIRLDNACISFSKAPAGSYAINEYLDGGIFNMSRGRVESVYDVAAMVSDTREALCRLFHLIKLKI